MALEAAGSTLDKVVKCTVLAVNSGTFDEINEVYAEYFTDVQATRTTVEVEALPTPIAVEFKVVASAE